MHSPAGTEVPQIAPRCGFCWAGTRGAICRICGTRAGFGGGIPPERQRAIDGYCRATFGVDLQGLRAFVQDTGELSQLAHRIGTLPGYSNTSPSSLVASFQMLRGMARPDPKLRRAMIRSGRLP